MTITTITTPAPKHSAFAWPTAAETAAREARKGDVIDQAFGELFDTGQLAWDENDMPVPVPAPLKFFRLLTQDERNATRDLYRTLRTDITHTVERHEARSLVRRVVASHLFGI